MGVSIYIKSVVASILDKFGIVEHFIDRYSKDNFLVLMYHRVLPAKERDPGLEPGMYVEPDTFDMHIRYLKKHFMISPLSEAVKYLEGTFPPQRQPVCILTFDDGWRDFHTYAYPILRRHGVPATVFLPTSFIGASDRFWTDSLSRLCHGRAPGAVNRNQAGSTHPIIDLLENGDGTMEVRLERSIESMKALREEEIHRILDALRERWRIDPAPQSRDFLSWDEVREMHRSGIVSFGSHTDTHRILSTLREEEIFRELRRSKERLAEEGVVDPSFFPFAYPNGNHTDEIIRFVKQYGYSLAVTTRKGWNRYSDGGKAFELNRIGVHQDMTSTDALFASRILQIL
jgi:peptidoglycan/xylan/chitin deacetylase (PgdA/CDA1 family)